MPESFDRGALTEAVYYIMVALQTPMHGYCVMQHVSKISGGRVNLCPGTLYGAINNLLQKEWIRAVPGDGEPCRRKEYVLTDAGQEALSAEIDRLKELVEAGEKYRADVCGDDEG